MSIGRQILVIFLTLLLSFVFLRGFLNGVKHHQLNNSAYKKRKSGETFTEWLLYKRYRDILPSFLYRFYLAVILIHLLGLLTCIVLFLIHIENIGESIATGIYYFDGMWLLVIALFFWSPGPDYAYGRWIKKEKHSKRKRK